MNNNQGRGGVANIGTRSQIAKLVELKERDFLRENAEHLKVGGKKQF